MKDRRESSPPGLVVIEGIDIRRMATLRWEFRVRYRRGDTPLPPKRGKAWTQAGAARAGREAAQQLKERNRSDLGWTTLGSEPR